MSMVSTLFSEATDKRDADKKRLPRLVYDSMYATPINKDCHGQSATLRTRH